MPTERESFNLTIKYNGIVLDTETGIQVAEAYELPPHGRCIDVDALDADLTQLDMRTGEDDAIGFSIYEIDNAPTIIPAEDDIDIQKKFMQNWHEEDE